MKFNWDTGILLRIKGLNELENLVIRICVLPILILDVKVQINLNVLFVRKKMIFDIEMI